MYDSSEYCITGRSCHRPVLRQLFCGRQGSPTALFCINCIRPLHNFQSSSRVILCHTLLDPGRHHREGILALIFGSPQQNGEIRTCRFFRVMNAQQKESRRAVDCGFGCSPFTVCHYFISFRVVDFFLLKALYRLAGCTTRNRSFQNYLRIRFASLIK